MQAAKLNLSSFSQFAPNEMAPGLLHPPKRQTVPLSAGQNLPLFLPTLFSPASNLGFDPFPPPNKETLDKLPKNQSANTGNGLH
jgi:hypothetical protein